MDKLEQDFERFRYTLVDGSDDDRQLLMDELAATRNLRDYSPLRHRLIADLRGDFSPKQSFQLRDPNKAPSIRSFMLSALGEISSKADSDAVDCFNFYLSPEHEPSEWVRYWSLSSLYRIGCDQLPTSMPGELPGTLLKAIQASRGDQGALSELLSHLASETQTDVWAVLRALRIVALPETLPLVCKLLQMDTKGPQDAIPYDALHALANPSIRTSAAQTLYSQLGASAVVKKVVHASAGSTRPHVQKFGALLALMDREAIRTALESERASKDKEIEVAALTLLEMLPVQVAAGPPSVAGYLSDTIPIDKQPLSDELGIGDDVTTLSSVLLAKTVNAPLAIGLFGDWGTGKSYFMEALYREIKATADLAATAKETGFYGKVIQVRFNAWHYADANLWASLVSYIFDVLAQEVAPNENPEETRKRLLKELESARQMRQEALMEQQQAATARSLAAASLDNAVRDRHQKQVQISDLRVPDILDVLNEKEHEKLKTGLDENLQKLGFPAAVRSVEELNSVYRDAFSLAGRARTLFVSIQNDKNRVAIVVLLILVVAGVPLAALLLAKVQNSPWIGMVGGLVAEGATVVTGFVAAARKYLGPAEAYLKDLEMRRQSVMEVLDKKRQVVSKEEVRLKNELETLRGQEEAAQQVMDAADARVEEIKQKLVEIDAGRNLSRFILERVQSEDYRKHLGIISTIRKDFERLTKLLGDGEAGFEKVGRIILYVDDLDRCSADKVVEVLQAVHLLLAMPLFIVVVGVDLRWLLHALDERYSALRTSATKRQNGIQLRSEWTTSPQNYLEKIFQIPFNLQPMSSLGYGKLISTLLPNAAEQAGQKDTGLIQKSTPQPPVQVVNVQVPSGNQPGALHATGQGQLTNIGPPPQSQQTTQAVEPPKRDLNPESLKIQTWEMEFAQAMYEFVATPRSAKRFTNVYRLLKAPLSGDKLREFEGTKLQPGEFQAAMLLLAVATSMGSQAVDLFPEILRNANSPDSWRQLFNGRLTMTAAQKETVANVRLDNRMAPFVEWVPRVARFTFEVGKTVAAAGAEAEPVSKTVSAKGTVPKKRVAHVTKS